MKIKSYIVRCIKLFLLIIIPLLICCLTQNRNDNNTLRIQGFYLEEKNSLDVVFLGASEVFSDYSASYAYDKYKFTSYPYAISGNFIDLYKSQLIEIHKYQSPKLIVIELDGATYEKHWEMKEYADSLDATLRTYTDSIPMSRNKINTINAFGKSKDMMSYYVPFIMYHGDINNIRNLPDSLQMNSIGYSRLKGISTCNREYIPQNYYNVEKGTPLKKLTAPAEQELRSFLKYCRKKDYNILFTRFPHCVISDEEYNRCKMSNHMEAIVKEYGYDFIDFDERFSEIGLDYSKDFYDNDHMNINGQKKFTDYIGNILTTDYKISPRKLSAENQERWNQSTIYTNLYYDYYDTIKDKDEEIWLLESKSLYDILDSFKKQ